MDYAKVTRFLFDRADNAIPNGTPQQKTLQLQSINPDTLRLL
jgi:hypothetical protein